jgi:chitodextrinase
MRIAFFSEATRQAAVAAIVLTSAGCTMKSQEAPALTGPSEFAQSITISASPDVLSQDGSSQSVITVTVRGPNAEPLRNVSLRVETQVGGSPVDFGSMSSRNIVTGADGRASLVYTAPAAPAVAVDNFTIVEIVVTPIGTDFNNTATRRASIRLVPPGVVVPPDGLTPYFSFTPESPQESQLVLFQACNDVTRPCSPANNPIASYSWNFGDGGRDDGPTASHDFGLAGSYTVTLTVTDQYGRTASVSQLLTVTAGVNPTAAFVFSPSSPRINQTIAFNAAASAAAPGRRIVGYTWDFGDGTGPRGGGSTINYVYHAVGTYNVTLLVTDDAGKTAAVTITVDVLP